MQSYNDFGIKPRHYQSGNQRLACPRCDKSLKDTALSLDIQGDGSFVFLCHRCGWCGGSGHAKGITPVTPPKPANTRASGFDAYSSLVWAQTRPITPECVAARYLIGRCCALPPHDSDLRWHANLKHRESGRWFPALIGLVTSIEDARQLLGIHRTYLAADGSGQANVHPIKKYWGNVTGGCIRLWPDDSVTTGLGIGEGVETCLSLALAFTPVWCCMDAGHLEAFPVLGGIESLTIAADNDDAGLKAAEACAGRWQAAGREVRVIASSVAREDFNDVAVRHG